MRDVVVRRELALVLAVPIDDPDAEPLRAGPIAQERDLRPVGRPARRDAPRARFGELDDAIAGDRHGVDLGGRRIIKKKIANGKNIILWAIGISDSELLRRGKT